MTALTRLRPDRDQRILALIAAMSLPVRDGMAGALDVFAHHYSWQCPLRLAMETLYGWDRFSAALVALRRNVVPAKREKLRRALGFLLTAAERMETAHG